MATSLERPWFRPVSRSVARWLAHRAWWMAPIRGETFGMAGALAVVDDGVRRWLWEGDEAERCHWMDLELAARLDGLLVRQHGVAPLVVRRGHLAQEQGQEEEPVPRGRCLLPLVRSEHSG